MAKAFVRKLCLGGDSSCSQTLFAKGKCCYLCAPWDTLALSLFFKGTAVIYNIAEQGKHWSTGAAFKRSEWELGH